tara:strand:- start:670 stop:1329 length:660 start_codon:yes stop_codon:yes gene_type:complete
MVRNIFRFISFIASAIFLWNSTIFIFYNFGLFWTFASYFTFFITFLFFPIWAYFFFGYFDFITTLAWFITVVEALSETRYRDKETKRMNKLNTERAEKEAIQILVFPEVSELSEYMDDSGNFLENQKTEKWIQLNFDPNFKFTGWKYSPKIAEIINKNPTTLLTFQRSAQTWGDHISSQYEKENEINLNSLPKTIISNPKFLVIDPMKQGYFTEGNEEE